MFDVESVEVSYLQHQKAVWKFAGKSQKGDDYLYEVTDQNYSQRNCWEFSVRVPQVWTKGNYIQVRPRTVPNRRIWAGSDLKVLSFQRATMGPHKGRFYSKLPIADVTGEKTKIVLTRSNRPSMPKWLRFFDPLLKKRVISTRGNDEDHLVAVLDKNDHENMIRLFVGLRPWVLANDYNPAEARKASQRKSLREKRARIKKSLQGKVVAVTGKFGYGKREKVRRLLKQMGAKINSHPTQRADLLLVGAHYLEDERLKIQQARTNGIPMQTEVQFRKKYSV